jgi:23S rRNA U2552 (ribose-2'-O)-methylase RlmE/FtsJ
VSVHEKLLRILENTSDFVINDMWPDDTVTLDEIATELLGEHAHELAERIRNSEELRDFTDDHMSDCNASADFIDPEVPNG